MARPGGLGPASTRSQAKVPNGYEYGCFWWVHPGAHAGVLAFGYAVTIAVFPSLDLVVRTGRGSFDVRGILRPILAALDAGATKGS